MTAPDSFGLGSVLLGLGGTAMVFGIVYAVGHSKGRHVERQHGRALLQVELDRLPKFFTAEAVATDPNARHQAVVKKALDDVLLRLESPSRAYAMRAKNAMKQRARNAVAPLNRALA